MPIKLQRDGGWQIVQGEGTIVTFNLQQEGTQIRAGIATVGGQFADTGLCKGQVSDTDVSIDVQWNNGPHGIYQGRLGLDGHLFGNTFDVNNASSQAPWHSVDANFASSP